MNENPSGGSAPAGSVEVRRAGERFVSRDNGIVSRHSFSFGPHYDPGNVGFGLLVVCNDDELGPGAGYPTHAHRDVEIVTWVLEGTLVHRDTTGAGGVVRPGLVQRMSAGRGVTHSEFNLAEPVVSAPGASGSADGSGSGGASGSAALRFVQMWVPPDVAGREPGYAQQDVTPGLAGGDLVVVASGMPRHRDSAVSLGQRAAAMHVARPRPGRPVVLPGAPFVHLFVARGAVDVEGVGRLGAGDAVRLTDEGGRTVHAVTPATPDTQAETLVTPPTSAPPAAPAAAPAEIIVWEMHQGVGSSR